MKQTTNYSTTINQKKYKILIVPLNQNQYILRISQCWVAVHDFLINIQTRLLLNLNSITNGTTLLLKYVTASKCKSTARYDFQT